MLVMVVFDDPHKQGDCDNQEGPSPPFCAAERFFRGGYKFTEAVPV